MSKIHASHYEWIVNDEGLTVGAIVTTHWCRGALMDVYLDIHRQSPKTKRVYEGEFMTIVETYLHESTD